MTWFLDDQTMFVGTLFQESLSDHYLFTDASDQGWGAHLRDLETSSEWGKEQREWTMELELQRTDSSSPGDPKFSPHCKEFKFTRFHGQHLDSCLHTAPRWEQNPEIYIKFTCLSWIFVTRMVSG